MIKNNSIANYVFLIAILTVPFKPFLPQPLGITLSNWFLLISIPLLVIRNSRNNNTIFSKHQLAALVFLCLNLVFISTSALVTSSSVKPVYIHMIYSLYFVAIFLYIDSVSNIQRLLQITFLLAVLMSTLTIIHILLFPNGLPFGGPYYGQRTVAGITFPFQRSLGIDMTYGAFGMYLMIATPYYLFRNLNNPSMSEVLGIILIFISVLMSQSRSTWIAVIVVMIVVFTGYSIRIRKQYIKYIFTSAILLLIILSPIILDTLISISTVTYSQRINQYQSAITAIIKNPIFGAGFGNVSQYHSGEYLIHSSFLNLAAESGIPAVLLIIIVWMTAISNLMRNIFFPEIEAPFAIGLLASLSAIFIESNLQPSFTEAPWIVLAIALSTFVVLSNPRTEEG